jgi:hypothetical protein
LRPKKIEGATALRPLRPLSIVPQSFLRFPAQPARESSPAAFSWQEESENSTVESCARLWKIPNPKDGNWKIATDEASREAARLYDLAFFQQAYTEVRYRYEASNVALY